MTTSTASQRGKANNSKGKKAERDVARWLRDHGFGAAERTIRTGYATSTRRSADTGDVSTLGICWQVKDVNERAWSQIPQWMIDTESQRVETGADIGILVVKRHGHADPGRWWAWLTLDTLAVHRMPGSIWAVPIRLTLADLVPLLHHHGYGSETDT